MDEDVTLIIECLEKYKAHAEKEKINLAQQTSINDAELITKTKIEQADYFIGSIKDHNSFDNMMNNPDFHVAIVWAASDYTHSLNVSNHNPEIDKNLRIILSELREILLRCPRSPLVKKALEDMDVIFKTLQE